MQIKEKDILKFSTDLQCILIKKFAENKNTDTLFKIFLTEIVKKAAILLNADACSIFITEKTATKNETLKSIMRVGTGYHKKGVDEIWYKVLPPEVVPENPTNEEKLGVTGWVISTGRAFLSSSEEEIRKLPHCLGKGVPDDQELDAFLAVPLRTPRGKIIGGFKAERLKKSKPFSVVEQMLLETFAQIAGRSIVHLEDVQNNNINSPIIAWVLDVITETVASEENLDDFLDIVVRLISAGSLADSCSIFIKDESRKTLTQRAGYGSEALRRGIRSYQLPNPNKVSKSKISDISIRVPENEKIGITAWITFTGKTFYAKNFDELKKHPHHTAKYDYINFSKGEICGAWFGVPLQVVGEPIGVLKIENIRETDEDKRIFSKEIQGRAEYLSQYIALAIERLQFRSKTRFDVLTNARSTIFEILSGNLDVPKLIEKVVNETARLFNARACGLFLKEGNQLIQPIEWASWGWAKSGLKVRKYDLIPEEKIVENPIKEDEKVGLTVWIAVKKKTFTAKSNLELTLHPHHKGTYDKDNFKKGEQCETFMGVPLFVGKELIGVLKVETKMKEDYFAYFNEQDELVFEFIANSAAIAIQNARLMESRVLADKISAQPNMNEVVHELYNFVQERIEVLNTLETTASIVITKDAIKANIIQHFTKLLNPNFRVAILGMLANLTENPLKEILLCIHQLMKVETLPELYDLPKDGLYTVSIKKEYFISESIELLTDIWEKIEKKLSNYRKNVHERKNLYDCIKFIQDGKLHTKIEGLNPFEKNIVNIVFNNWEKIIQKTSEEFHSVLNPYVAGQPLEPDSKIFVGRKDVFNWVKEKLDQTTSCVLVLHGIPHSGKTSLLKQLEAGPLGKNLRERKDSPIFPIFIDLQRFHDIGTYLFFYQLSKTIYDSLYKKGIRNIKLMKQDFTKDEYVGPFQELLENITQKLKKHKNGILLLMLDEFEQLDVLVKKNKIDSGIFRVLRSEMQHNDRISFILAGRKKLDDLPAELINPIFDVSTHMHLDLLDNQEAIRLIIEPVRDFGVTYDKKVVNRIVEITHGHPYLIQQLCHFCIELLNKEESQYNICETHLDKAIDKSLLEGSRAVLSEIWGESSEDEKIILNNIAKLFKKKRTWINEKEILKLLEKKYFDVLKYTNAFNNLKMRQIIIEKSFKKQKETYYRFAIDLLRLLIIRLPQQKITSLKNEKK